MERLIAVLPQREVQLEHTNQHQRCDLTSGAGHGRVGSDAPQPQKRRYIFLTLHQPMGGLILQTHHLLGQRDRLFGENIQITPGI